ncbi:serine protease [Sphingobacterium cellulitidis]|uniref:NfeD family protein n=1 Tax=Sphingobacterium cellulitidis TaxID=1768011 RepID=UPI000B944CF5|nr:NfeD family protein [Sphingobacterium cellulitidis]OYD46222.1 serine protease [Sphingobacterium cellulitidis]
MNKFTKYILGILVICFVSFFQAKAQTVYSVPLKEDIGPNAWRTMKNAIKQAKLNKSEYLLIDLNTFGGALNFADSIRSSLLNENQFKTIVYVNNNAASAGALISLAADYIYMHSGSSLGAASVVNQNGEILPEKYQSYMRGLMRATAEAKGRDPKIAEAFVDPAISVPELKEDGKLLTLTASEAVKVGIAKKEIKSEVDIFSDLNIEKPQIQEHQTTWVDHLIGWLINPLVSGLLIMGIIGGIYFELQSPGIGFALLVALVCGALFFAPLYLQGLADNWEIAIFVLGVILLVLEIFVIPGFGVAGIAGIILVLCGLAFSMVANDYFDFKLTQPGLLMNSFIIVIGAMILTIVLMVIFGKNILQSPTFKRLVLEDEQKATEGYTSSVAKPNLINKVGITKTVLRPGGKIEIDNVWYDAVALDSYIDVGEEIYVEKHENYNLFVRKISEKKA